MRTQTFILVIAALALTACGIKSSSDSKKETDKILADLKTDIEGMTDSLYVGGQPGEISINGVVVSQNDDQNVLNEKIRISQVGGKGKNDGSEVAILPSQKPVLKQEFNGKFLEKVEPLKTYINFGCVNIPADEIAGFEQKADGFVNDSMMNIQATKIFFCGQSKFIHAFVTMTADELILNNVSLSLTAMVGSLKLSAGTLTLNGENTIETIGADATISVLAGPSLDLTIARIVQGNGSLQLVTKGGNCIEKEVKK